MTRHDYSLDAPLLEYEIDDFDTKSYAETGEHPTGINIGRMRLPVRYDIAKYYKRHQRSTKAVTEDGEEVTRRRGEYGVWKNKEQKDLIDFSKDFEWQITYNFPDSLHPNITAYGKKYGGSNVTYRRLYLILCERFNGGNFFIDDYFDTVYPHTVKPEIDERLDILKSELLEVAEAELEGAVATKEGDFDKRYKANRGMKAKLKRYESFARQWEESEGEYLASIIKEDIISCMMSGQLQTETNILSDSEETKKRRLKAGLSAEPTFLAIGNLIEHLQLFISLGGNKQWQTKQGIMV